MSPLWCASLAPSRLLGRNTAAPKKKKKKKMMMMTMPTLGVVLKMKPPSSSFQIMPHLLPATALLAYPPPCLASFCPFARRRRGGRSEIGKRQGRVSRAPEGRSARCASRLWLPKQGSCGGPSSSPRAPLPAVHKSHHHACYHADHHLAGCCCTGAVVVMGVVVMEVVVLALVSLAAYWGWQRPHWLGHCTGLWRRWG